MTAHVPVGARPRAESSRPQSVRAGLNPSPSLKEMGLSPMPPVWAEGVSPNDGARPVNDKVPGTWRTETRPDGKCIRIFTPARAGAPVPAAPAPAFDWRSIISEETGLFASMGRILGAVAARDLEALANCHDDLHSFASGLADCQDVLALLDPEEVCRAYGSGKLREALMFLNDLVRVVFDLRGGVEAAARFSGSEGGRHV